MPEQLTILTRLDGPWPKTEINHLTALSGRVLPHRKSDQIIALSGTIPWRTVCEHLGHCRIFYEARKGMDYFTSMR